MQNPEALDEARDWAPEALRDVPAGPVVCRILFRKRLCNLILTMRIVMVRLGRLLTIYDRSEDVMETKLAGEDVHHHPGQVLVVIIGAGFRRIRVLGSTI
jgi:hypothetical protein